MQPKVRLQKFIAECGVASRRKAEELIKAGEVKVNGRIIDTLGTKIDPATDKIEIGGLVVRWLEKKVYIKLNKPRGYVSSCVSQKGERTILDLVKDVPGRLYPVGRLDCDSEGLMILTNDGELANKLMHPRYEHEKEYLVDVTSPVTSYALNEMGNGMEIEGEKTKPAKVKQISEKSFSIILKEGKKRQIRLMVEAVGNRVVKLKRIRIKNILLGGLPAGQYQYLSAAELKSLNA